MDTLTGQTMGGDQLTELSDNLDRLGQQVKPGSEGADVSECV